MIVRSLPFDQKSTRNKTTMFVDRLPQMFVLGMGFSLLLTFVAWCIPRQTQPAARFNDTTPSTSSLAITNTPKDPVPALAYYYIWFDPQSWDRAKKDFPLVGRYSSDDVEVMRQHIRWAKAAGIDGFIVSWKSNDKLNHRLDQLVEIADEEDFKLAIIYESLDFRRNPLPLDQVGSDLTYFIEHYSRHPAFDLFEKPLVIWSGTWEFSVDEIKRITQNMRERSLILASEKNLEGYQRLSAFVDGNAYYWSSVNPNTHSGYSDKLMTMGDAIHKNKGIWIAPAAPGFDARLIGGDSVVERKDGETLRTELKVALQSLPDAIGLISWNEFSENSYIEPSQNYGSLYLDVLADTRLVIPSSK
jgi:glycosyl hydrolase family 99